MSLLHTRQTPSLPPTDSTLASSLVRPSSSTLVSSPLKTTPDPSLGRTASNSSSLGHKSYRPRKSGGFLLDTATEDDAGRHRERDAGGQRGRGAAGFFAPDVTLRIFREPTPEVDEQLTGDTDPARIVSLALTNGATRKAETTWRGVKQRSASASRWLSGDFGSEGNDRRVGLSTPLGSSNGRDRAISPSRGFLMAGSIDQRRSVSTGHSGGGNEARRLSPLNPSNSPPPPLSGLRLGYPSPLPSLSSLLPTSTFPYQQLQKKRGLQGQEQLREVQKQYKFSEATLQRTLKAKQQLELSALYKRLLTIYPLTDVPPRGFPKDGSVGRVYNPLMSIRNKRIRNRERIQLDLSSWEDPGAVEQWIEDVAVAVHELPGDPYARPPMLPPPPQPSGTITKQKRPRLDWVISPQELLAEFYWIEDGDRMRREETHYNSGLAEQVRGDERTKGKGKGSQLSLRSLLEREEKKPRGSFELTRLKRSSRKLDDDVSRASDPAKKTLADTKHRAEAKVLGESPRFPTPGPENYVYSDAPSSSEESGRSSESEMDYQDEDFSDMEVDTSGAEEAKRKHHRRRRKLGQIITGGKRGAKKVKKRRSDAYALDADERRKRQEIEEMEWMAEMGGRMVETAGRGYSADEEYDSAAAGLGLGLGRNGHVPGLNGSRAATGTSLPPTLGGSRSSLERYGSAVVGRGSMDFTEVVVPSIAISLSPPRIKTRDEGYDTDSRGRVGRKEEAKDREKRKLSPTKKLFERSQEAFVRAREGSLDYRRGSMELARTGSDKIKDKTKSRVKSRVEKIRNEVAKVEDFILRRDPGGSAAASPTGSSFAESIGSPSDDDRNRLTRENTVSASEAEDDGRRGSKTWGRGSLEVPDSRRPGRSTKYRSSHSTNYLPRIASPGISKAKWKPKTGLLQDDVVVTDVDTDDDRRAPRGINRLAPPLQTVSREPSPARPVVIQSADRFRTIALDTAKKPPKAPTPTDEERNVAPTAATLQGPFATRRDLMMAKAYLTRSGVVARGITAKRARARAAGAGEIVATAKEHMAAASTVSRDIHIAEQVFVRKANYFTDSTVLGLRRAVDRIRADIETVLSPMLGSVADGADALNEQLTTSCTLAVKGINDEAAAMARRKRRQLRWVRRGGYVLLEWAVLGAMWWVWLVVVVLNIVRGVLRVGLGAARWVLWI